ncbi:MAG: glycosyltransferase, partial [Rhodospirillales bacterium]|nr:glycosyltransferase [Rhodospirillales bacterium]
MLMPAYNAERYIRQSIHSVLSQTFEDFELLVVDDGSTDTTPEILASVRDPRLRVLRNATNLGVVGALNHGMAEARGRLIARLDADDLCHPTRFARQHAFLAARPSILMVGTNMSVLEAGRIRFTRPQADPDPLVLRWMLHLGNPIGHPSMMFRAEAVARFGHYLQEAYRSAEDFDFTHRLLSHGDVAVLPDHLVIYRQHAQNVTRVRRDEMTDRTAAVLRRVHADLLGTDPEDSHLAREAGLVATHLVARHPVPDRATLVQLGAHLTRLLDAFARRWNPDERQLARIRATAGRTWWRSAEQAIAGGQVGAATGWRGAGQPWTEETRPHPIQVARWRAAGLARAVLPAPGPRTQPVPPAPRRIALAGVRVEEEPHPAEDPPSLYVVVDTEAEFDWAGGFDRSLTRVTAMREQHRAQAVFDAYGARPIYVIDHPVASQPEGWEPLRDILARRAGVVGAHLHPWVNPPFEEPISERNSFAGNLPPDLEARKLRSLVAAIEANLGVRPLFFKAGRYGLGPHTFQTLAQLGIAVDFSILPLADLRPRGGPDFRAVRARPYRVPGGEVRTIPM